MSTDHEYDPDLPYVVASPTRLVIARFRWLGLAEEFSDGVDRIIDTTPKPRVPEDAKFITWTTGWHRSYAEASDMEGRWDDSEGCHGWLLEDLPGVTPDTVFTVLDERKNDD